jgi:hypothetical protein
VFIGNEKPSSSIAVHVAMELLDEKEDVKRPRTIGVFAGVVSYIRMCNA